MTQWHIGMTEMWRTPLHRGFDTFLGFWGGSEDYWSHHSGAYLDFRDGEQLAWGASATTDEERPDAHTNATYSTHLFSNRAVQIISNVSQGKGVTKPFFIYLAYQVSRTI
jgi:hypothetical protein